MLGFNTLAEKNASLVQLVERRSPKPDVEGSSPSGRVTFNLIFTALQHSIRFAFERVRYCNFNFVPDRKCLHKALSLFVCIELSVAVTEQQNR